MPVSIVLSKHIDTCQFNSSCLCTCSLQSPCFQRRVILILLRDLFFPCRSGNGGNGGGGGSFLSYLQEQTGPGWIPVTDPTQAWVGSQPKPRQAMDTMMSSVRNAMDGDQSHVSQEALLQPVRDMGHSEILRGHFRGTQPFEKGLGFPHRVPELRTWDDVRLKGQVSALFFFVHLPHKNKL